MKIALASIDPIWENKIKNMNLCHDYIKCASDNSSQIIFFPEMTLTGFSMNISQIGENYEKSETIDFFREMATKYQVVIFFGIVLINNGNATNNLITIDDQGNILSLYSKVHPFSYSGENKYYIGGDHLSITNYKDISIGSSICYDLRFPEIFQSLSETCQIISIIANWPEKRIQHWKILLQARAIENQCFIIGTNRIGTDGNGITYPKSSYVFNPLGEEQIISYSWENLDFYDIKPELVSSIRNSFPMKLDRRKEFYKSLL